MTDEAEAGAEAELVERVDALERAVGELVQQRGGCDGCGSAPSTSPIGRALGALIRALALIGEGALFALGILGAIEFARDYGIVR